MFAKIKKNRRNTYHTFFNLKTAVKCKKGRYDTGGQGNRNNRVFYW
jgi:hypothetical protein